MKGRSATSPGASSDAPAVFAPRIRLLTGGDIEMDDDLAVGPVGRMPRALLTMLLLEGDHAVARDRLAARLWPDADQSTVRHRLRMTLHALRQALDEGLPESLESNGDSLRLDLPRDWTDVHLFEDASRSGQAAIQAAETALYRGALLEGFPSISAEFDAYLEEKREVFRNIALASVHTDLAGLSGKDDRGIFEERYRRALAIDPGNERTFLLAMEYWARARSSPDIARVLSEARSAAKREFDAELSDELEAAAERMMIEAARPKPASPPEEPQPVAVEAKAQPPGRHAGRRNWSRARVAGASAIATALAAAVVLTVIDAFSPARSQPVIRLASEADGGPACAEADLVARFEASFLGVVQQVGEAVFLMANAPGTAGSADLVLHRSLHCLAGTARASVSLTDTRVGSVVWIRRYDFDPLIPGPFEAEVLSDLQAEVRQFAIDRGR